MGVDMVWASTTMGKGTLGGFLIAWDPVARREVWRVPQRRPWNGGTLTTAGNLVFQGTGEARFEAYRATDGEKLFSAPAGTGVIAPPVTYRVDGEQYVSVMAGWGGGFALASADPPAETLAGGNAGRLLTFKLGGHASLPAPQRVIRSFESIDANFPAAEVDAGMRVFHTFCAACHGPAAIGGGTIPDLRTAEPAVYDALPEIVLEGALLAKGMPRFGKWLDTDDVVALRAYLLSRRALLVSERGR
jgi:quinohemoprotein ethanol dehydrogenase